MTCANCNNILLCTDYIIGTHLYCEICKFEEIKQMFTGNCCTKPDYSFVKHYSCESDFHSETENYAVWEQCSNCGNKRGNARKKREFSKSQLSRSHEFLFEDIEQRKKEFILLANRLEKTKKEETFTNKHQKYTYYINSERWRKISKEVLKRDKNRCQSCLVNEAVEVHHADYTFLENEPLFTLFSVCRSCHEIITKIQKQGSTEKIPRIKYRFDQDI